MSDLSPSLLLPPPPAASIDATDSAQSAATAPAECAEVPSLPHWLVCARACGNSSQIRR
jgi:hypothetical protein